MNNGPPKSDLLNTFLPRV